MKKFIHPTNIDESLAGAKVCVWFLLGLAIIGFFPEVSVEWAMFFTGGMCGISLTDIDIFNLK